MADQQLQFAPFSSFLDAGFWHQLSFNKLNVYGLDDSVKQLHGFYFNGDQPGMPCRLTVDHTAFNLEDKTPSRCFRSLGHLHNTNTIDDFRGLDKKALLDQYGQEIWQCITSGEAVKNPAILSKFVVLTHADLKKYHYYYWFAFPCLSPTEDFRLISAPQKVHERFSEQQVSSLISQYNTQQSQHANGLGFFIIVPGPDGVLIDEVRNAQTFMDQKQQVMFGFADPCTLEQNPGWPLRNFLAMISYHWGGVMAETEVVCLRYQSKAGNHDLSQSLVLNVKMSSIGQQSACPKCVGWEKNERQKLGARMVNLSASMDPSRLAESAVDLNLKLMRWRLLPDLDLKTIADTKCLLLGAGTLGCNVARCLLGWGVRQITLVDNGRVSYSNPVRQTLFVFDDCKAVAGGKPKAQAAAEALKQIFPGVNSEGVSLSIPMPGHTVADSAVSQTREDVEKLDQLVASHDAVFLLLDTRESRWLPTVMAASKKKTVICAALGFDTYLVMRHGQKVAGDQPASGPAQPSLYKHIPGSQLGCYFCNDVVAPGDSTKDRTLDQQCTVSRPGMSYIASALAVELLVSVLQHPHRGDAPGDMGTDDDTLTEHESPLGIVPHQIRGFLSRFQQVMPASRAFDKCTACSQTVIDRYEREGFEFLLHVFNEPHYLEDLTGLTEMKEQIIDAEVWDYDEDEDFSSMDSA